jgi:hypothetical protein
MNKEERKQYLMAKHMELTDPIGEIPTTAEDVWDEVAQLAAYEAHIRDEVNTPLTSDE